MRVLSDNERVKIAELLKKKGAVLPCPRCGNNVFTILDGYCIQSIQSSKQGLILGGPGVPCAVAACNCCGYLSHHALGALGLLDPVSDLKCEEPLPSAGSGQNREVDQNER